jgi:SPFH domain / Band 7 family
MSCPIVRRARARCVTTPQNDASQRERRNFRSLRAERASAFGCFRTLLVFQKFWEAIVADSLDWGHITYTSVTTGAKTAKLGGYQLFLLDNSEVSFPRTDLGLVSVRWHTAIGYINLNPINYAVAFDDTNVLISADNHKFRALMAIQIELDQSNREKWSSVVLAHRAIENKILSVVQDIARDLFNDHTYKEIRNKSQELTAKLRGLIAAQLPERAYYNLRSLSYEAESLDPVIDESISESIQSKTRAEEEAEANKRAVAKADAIQSEQIRLDGIQAAYDRKKMTDDASTLRKIKKEEEEEEFENFKRIKELSDGDLSIFLAYRSPELLLELLKSENQKNKEIEKAKIQFNGELLAARAKSSVYENVIGFRHPTINIRKLDDLSTAQSDKEIPDETDN